MPSFPTRYRRNLPHIQPYGAVLFLTYRLAGSLPESVVREMREERVHSETMIDSEESDPDVQRRLRARIRRKTFMKFEALLERAETGPTWLGNPEIAALVLEAMLYRHPEEYELVCATVMPNHVHQVVINRHKDWPMYETIGRLKQFTATRANRILGRRGTFWQEESFDHAVRKGKLGKTIRYVLDNPVSAGLAAHWSAWPYSWLNPRFQIDS